MSRNVKRVQYVLDIGNVKSLPDEDIKMILRAADELIAKAGRNMLAKILKGSKEKKVLELKLNECPAYGYYKDLKIEEITNRIDWMIKIGYLEIIYQYRLPVLVFSDAGWQIERETYAEELYQEFCLDVKEKNARVIYKMKTTNRQVVMRILDKIEKNGDEKFIPYLEAWKAMTVRKVTARINEVEDKIKSKSNNFAQ